MKYTESDSPVGMGSVVKPVETYIYFDRRLQPAVIKVPWRRDGPHNTKNRRVYELGRLNTASKTNGSIGSAPIFCMYVYERAKE